MIMKEENIVKTKGSTWVPFVIGGVVGAGLALLLAPKPGREMRKQIKDFTANAKEKVASTYERGREFYGETKAALSNAIDAGKEAFVKEREAHITH